MKSTQSKGQPKLRKRHREDEYESDAMDDEESGTAAASTPKTRKKTTPGKSENSAKKNKSAKSGDANRCARCRRYSGDVKFAVSENRIQAATGQCVDCYSLWQPLSLLMTWPEFVDKCAGDDDFGKAVSQAAKNPELLQTIYMPFFKTDVSKLMTMGVKVSSLVTTRNP